METINVKRSSFRVFLATSAKMNFKIQGSKEIHFPVCVCFATTTKKAQVQTFSGALDIFLHNDFFAYRQPYVAMSRITHPSNSSAHPQRDDYATTNVSYKSISAFELSQT